MIFKKRILVLCLSLAFASSAFIQVFAAATPGEKANKKPNIQQEKVNKDGKSIEKDKSNPMENKTQDVKLNQ